MKILHACIVLCFASAVHADTFDLICDGTDIRSEKPVEIGSLSLDLSRYKVRYQNDDAYPEWEIKHVTENMIVINSAYDDFYVAMNIERKSGKFSRTLVWQDESGVCGKSAKICFNGVYTEISVGKCFRPF